MNSSDVELVLAQEIQAHNYGAAHANKIHSDEGAAEYGFAGALVPGVALYAYLLRPVMDFPDDKLAIDLLERGTVSAKFIHPIYDGERVRAEAKVISYEEDPFQFELQLLNSENSLCAVGRAATPVNLPSINPTEYPAKALPTEENRWPATIQAVSAGEILGSLDFTFQVDSQKEFLENLRDDSPLYRAADGVCHPAFWIAQANEVFMQNFALGMWIHTSSETQHYALARDSERLTMRGRIVETSERRGHEIVTADLVVFGEADRVIATIQHSAIIRLKA